MIRTAMALAAALVLCAAPRARAQSGGPVRPATLELGVRGALTMALENNRSLAVERYQPGILETFAAEEGAVFDPVLSSEIAASETTGQRTSGVGEFRDVSSRSKDVSIGLSKQTPLGPSAGIEARMNTRESNVFTRLYSTRVGATITVPLLQGLGSDVNLAGVRLAEKDVELSRHELRGYVESLCAGTEANYWDLLAAREALRILLGSLELARQQLRETRDRIEVGDIAEIELAAAEGEVALREKAVIDAEAALETSRLRLLQRLNPPGGDFWNIPVELSDEPPGRIEVPASAAEWTAIAMRSRPDLNQARLQTEMRDIETVRTRNGLLPRLDFFLALGNTGYARAFGDSISNMLDDDNMDLNAGFAFRHALGNRAARSRHERASLRQHEAEDALRNLEQLIELDIRVSLAEARRADRQIPATRAAAGLQEATYLAELEKFRVGKSTNLLVLAAQRELTQSQLDELRARVNLAKALLELRLAAGVLLDHHQLAVPDGPPAAYPAPAARIR